MSLMGVCKEGRRSGVSVKRARRRLAKCGSRIASRA